MYALLEKTMNEIYGITKKEVGIVNEKGLIVAFSNVEKINEVKNVFLKNFKPTNYLKGQFKNYYFESLNLNENEKYYIFIKGFDKESLNYLKIIKTLITKIYLKNNNSQEKKEFIKRILTQEVNYKELEINAKKYSLKLNLNSIVFLVYVPKENFKEILKQLNSVFNKNKNILIEIDFFCIAVIRKINSNFDEKSFFKFLKETIEKINKNFNTNIIISVGKIANGLKNIKKSFEQAKTALKIKTIFKNKNPIVRYDELGFARLIDTIPTQICEIFLNEVLKKEKIEDLDEETVYTINKFFENNLNISETSRKLFIHRNTLVYRLEKIKKLTGLDLRIFENAATFKIALMVSKYLNFTQKKDLKI